MPSDSEDDWNSIREKIIGLGEQSIRKSYYPELQERLSELERFRALLDETSEAIFLSEIPFGKFTDFNVSACNQLGYSPQKMLEISFEDLFALDKLDEIRSIISNLIDRKHLKNRETVETVLKRSDNTLMDVEVSISLVSFGDSLYMVMVSRDITERKEFENALKMSLKEKEVLLREIHHRVKNNMQIISSLLNLQKSYVKDEGVVNILRESQNRVLSMAMVHELLYQTHDLTNINSSIYIKSLVTNLYDSYSVNQNTINSVLNLEDISLNIETAIPLGLIISELVSNSLKHAFPAGKVGEISITLHSDDDVNTLIIRDNGIGIPESVNLNKTKTLGINLVNNLIKQIDGELEYNDTQGTEFRIKFKEINYRKRI